MKNADLAAILDVQPYTPERIYTAQVNACTADVANIVLSDGRVAMIPVTEWFPGRAMPLVDETLQVVTLDGSQRPICSVTHPVLPQLLLESVVTEIVDGSVRIMGVARRPGVRTKISVAGTSSDIDAVSICVGKAANRVKAVSDALAGERVDVVAWHPDAETYVANALLPATVNAVKVRKGVANVSVDEHQAAAAVGAGGSNAVLVSELTGVQVRVQTS